MRRSASIVKGNARKRSVDFGLYLITDRRLSNNALAFHNALRDALRGGVKAVQLREKDLGTRELLILAVKMRKLTLKFNARLFINDRFDVALAVGADGVHLTQKSIPPGAVRNVVKDRLLIGVSTHSLKEARRAEREHADFVTLGPVYGTPSKRRYGPPVGLDTLKKVCSRLTIPVFAIGGIKSSRIQDVRDAGAYGVALISEIFASDNVKKKSGELVSMTDSHSHR